MHTSLILKLHRSIGILSVILMGTLIDMKYHRTLDRSASGNKLGADRLLVGDRDLELAALRLDDRGPQEISHEAIGVFRGGEVNVGVAAVLTTLQVHGQREEQDVLHEAILLEKRLQLILGDRRAHVLNQESHAIVGLFTTADGRRHHTHLGLHRLLPVSLGNLRLTFVPDEGTSLRLELSKTTDGKAPVELGQRLLVANEGVADVVGRHGIYRSSGN